MDHKKKDKIMKLVMLGIVAAVSMVSAESIQPRTHCRFVPERFDDFAWENDQIAFRTYGPAARERAENSGFDCWLKRVETPIIDKWYGPMKEKSYHKDWGEGHDPYHVGKTRGCGGLGLWIDGENDYLRDIRFMENHKERTGGIHLCAELCVGIRRRYI